MSENTVSTHRKLKEHAGKSRKVEQSPWRIIDLVAAPRRKVEQPVRPERSEKERPALSARGDADVVIFASVVQTSQTLRAMGGLAFPVMTRPEKIVTDFPNRPQTKSCRYGLVGQISERLAIALPCVVD